ncbi:MAG: hypothetical protein ABJM26_11195 [Anderseniella sp.]
MADNPYLKEGRLADVIAAITAMGNYRYYKLDFDKWAERINNKPDDGARWGAVFADHPEFFRINPDDKKASLVWRRQLPKRFDPKRSTELQRDEFEALSPGDRNGITRRPLMASELTALINVAVELHDRALEQKKADRYWIPILSAILAFGGALLGGMIARP